MGQRVPPRGDLPPGIEGMMPDARQLERPPEPLPADPDEAAPKPDKNYDEIAITKADEDKYKRQRPAILAILRAGKFEGNQAVFDEYINRYFLARWTQWKNVTSLPGFRKELGNYFKQTKSGQVYDRLNALVLDFMGKVARGNYSPAARINAILAIGELNGMEPRGSEPALPLPEALKALLDIVNGADYADGFRAAAMVGVLRHAESGARDEAARRSLADAMLRLATAELPAGPSAAGREWIAAQAVGALGYLGTPGEGNNVFNALLDIVADARYSNYTRSIAARALGQLNYAGAAGIDPVAAGSKLVRFAADCCAQEVRLSKEAAQPIPPQRIRQHLNAVLTALGGAGDNRKGISSLANQPDQQTLLTEAQKAIKEVSQPRGEGQEAGPVEELGKKLESLLETPPEKADKPQ